MKQTTLALPALALVAFAIACTQDTNPVAPTMEPSFTTESAAFEPSAAAVSKSDLGFTVRSVTVADVEEDFNCTNVNEVFVRFGQPGFVEGTDVGLFVEFRGMPAGPKIARVWWDYDGAPETHEDFDVEAESVRRDESGLFDFEAVFEHSYNVSVDRIFKARVELILNEQTGNCARNRHVTVGPSSDSAGRKTNHVLNSSFTHAAPGLTLADPFTGDVYRVVAPPGTVLTISIDTVSAATTFDPWFTMTNTIPPTGSLPPGFWTQDDDFGCTFPPPSFSCPSGSSTLPADPDGVYFFSAVSLNTNVAVIGSYTIRIMSSVPIARPTLVANDVTY